MSLEFGDKQPYEEYYVKFDFVNDVDEEDSIDFASVTVVDAEGNDATSTLTDFLKQEISGLKVCVWVKGGMTGITYTITCRIITSVLVEKYEAEATMRVLEI